MKWMRSYFRFILFVGSERVSHPGIGMLEILEEDGLVESSAGETGITFWRKMLQ